MVDHDDATYRRDKAHGLGSFARTECDICNLPAAITTPAGEILCRDHAGLGPVTIEELVDTYGEAARHDKELLQRHGLA